MSFKVKSLLPGLLTLLSGAVMALAMPPTAWWPLLFPCLSIFYVQLCGRANWRAFLTGWLFGFGYFVVGLYWIGNALLVPGNEFKWVWPLAIVGLPIGLAIFTGLAAFAATRIADLKNWRGFAAFVACLTLSEWLRGHVFTGFPWNLYGYAWAYQLAMVQSVSIFGVYGLTLISTLWTTLPGFLYTSRPQRKTLGLTIFIAALSIGGLYGWGTTRLQNNPTRYNQDLIVRLVQPSIPQEDKWNSEHLVPNLKKIVEISAAPSFIKDKTYAIIWPETAISDYIMQDINAARFIRSAIMQGPSKNYLISGTLRHEDGPDGKTIYHNSVVTYDQGLLPVDTYDKSHLVPFGEYIPFQNIIPMHPFVKFSGFTSGSGIATQNVSPLPPFSGLVCYEVIFPGKVALKGNRPAWMVNVTNDGWYGDSPGPYQHLTMAVYRAVEEGIPLVRAANTGISAIIDPNGRILRILNYNVVGYSDSPLPLALQNATYYSQSKDILFLIGIGLLGALIFIRRQPN